MALIVPSGYCSHIALHYRHFRDPSTSHCNNRISISPPWREKMACPRVRRGLIGGQKKEGWLISVNFISVVLVAGLLAGTWILECPASLLMASPSRFLPPCRIMFQASSGRLCSSCRDVSQQGPQGPPMRELVTGDPMARSVSGTPVSTPRASLPVISPGNSRLDSKHGCVESIDQLARYHTQFNTPTEWRCQFCSGETRFDRYAVYPEWLAFRFGEPKKQSCPVEHLSFLVHVVLDLIRWYPVCHAFNHRIEGISPPVFQFPPLTSEGV